LTAVGVTNLEAPPAAGGWAKRPSIKQATFAPEAMKKAEVANAVLLVVADD